MEKRKLIYITYNGLSNSVWDSQILPILRSLKDNSSFEIIPVTTDWFSCLSTRAYVQREKALKNLLPDSINALRPPYMGEFGFASLSRRIAGQIKKHVAGSGNKIILHGREPMAAYLGLKIRDHLGMDFPVLAEYRGWNSKEVETFLAAKWWMPSIMKNSIRHHMEKLETSLLKHADSAIFISEELKNAIVDEAKTISNNGIDPSKLRVIPSCIPLNFKYSDDLRAAARKELKIEDDHQVFIYSGGAQPWQGIDLIKKAITDILTQAPKAKIIVLSYAPQKWLCAMEDIPKRSSVIIRNAPHHEVPKYLCASDIGILMREKSPVNRVALPIKALEYMGCGLKLLATDTIGPIRSMAKENPDIGWIVQGSDIAALLSTINTPTQEDKKRLSDWAQSRFSLEKNTKSLLEIYSHLLSPSR
ncbi:glycosyltransferase [Elusimicrobiota bacterium]